MLTIGLRRGGRVRLKATVSKTVMGHWPIESSNLSLSATTYGGGSKLLNTTSRWSYVRVLREY
jgi:hypothetical protein